jgi:sulfoxide reductase heme-binding subunit YedZ
MIRRLGGRRWQLLHRLIYVAAVAAVIHFWWLVKSDIRRPAFYSLVVAVLLGIRVVRARTHARLQAPGSRLPAGGLKSEA